jgi:hypothetical protein
MARCGALCAHLYTAHKRTLADKHMYAFLYFLVRLISLRLTYIEENMKLRRAKQSTDSNSDAILGWSAREYLVSYTR